MRQTKTMLACVAATLLFSCSKKDEDKKTPPTETKKSYWTINGRKLQPTEVEQKDKSILFSVYQADTIYAQWYIGFEHLISEGSYSIGGLSPDGKEVYMFAEIRSAKVDSVYDSRSYETAHVNVSYTSDEKMVIEVPEIWLTNRNKPYDSCKFSGVFIEE